MLSIAAVLRPDDCVQIYLVGGAVRDQLLGLAVRERDWVVVGASAEDLLAKGFRQVGKDFPVFLHPETQEEYALARTERKQGHGYHGFTCHAAPDVTLEEDLGRRDLTVNAMAMTEDGALIDPYGGRRDLEARLLRHVSEAFAEDPLRVLRTARFAARLQRFGFTIHPSTLQLMRDIVRSGELDYLAPARIWVETARALSEEQASGYFGALAQCDAWQHLTKGLTAPEAKTGFTTLDTVENDVALRFAALTADCIHSNSGQRGCAKRLSEAFHASKAASDLAELTATLLDSAAQPPQSSAQWLQLLERSDALRRPERFAQALSVIAQHAEGKSSAISDYVNRLRSAMNAASGVGAQTLLQQGLRGPALGEALREQRRLEIHASLYRA